MTNGTTLKNFQNPLGHHDLGGSVVTLLDLQMREGGGWTKIFTQNSDLWNMLPMTYGTTLKNFQKALGHHDLGVFTKCKSRKKAKPEKKFLAQKINATR